MTSRWFLSKTVRQATYFRRQLNRLVNEQRDLLPKANIAALEAESAALSESIRTGSKEELKKRMTEAEVVANKNLRPYPHPAIRDNVKEILIAVTVILSVITFFVQLTKIPTGSLQPTLFGITYENLMDEPDFEMPGRPARFWRYWVHGVSYFSVQAKTSGIVTEIQPAKGLPFLKKQTFKISGVPHTIWFATDKLVEESGIRPGQPFQKGEQVLKMKVTAGDHLLVDRFTYNFRRPNRGEIIVFKTKGIPIGGQDLDVLYIKRLVALENERVRINDDQHLVINGEELTAATPGFENVYTFTPGEYEPNEYFGHVNNATAMRIRRSSLASYFPNAEAEVVVPEGHYMAMGDNTMNSQDSRDWGSLPQENVTGKAWFVYWPFTKRFGWGPR